MAEYVQWDSVPKIGGSGEMSEYLKLKSGNTYRIRPIFDPVKFFKYFHKHNNKLRTAICGKPDVCPVRDKHSELKKPSLRYAAYVIDRNDDNKVKILEAPQSVFRPIGSSFEATGKNPGSGKDGSDWQVKVTGTGLNTKYDVAFAGNTPLTAEERASIKEALDGDMKKLQKLYKVDTPEEIEAKLFGDLEDRSNESSSNTESSSNDVSFGDTPEVPASAPAPAPAPAESSGDDSGSDWESNF